MKKLTLFIAVLMTSTFTWASDLQVGSSAPEFKSKTQTGADFELNSRKGSWTVLYFYPKADTPGCTKQACAFRDDVEKIRKLNADILGVSVNSVEEQAVFHKKHNLNFNLIADADAAITKLYGSKMPVMKMSKRWTFILDPELKIRSIDKDVDPAMDARKVAKKIAELQAEKK